MTSPSSGPAGLRLEHIDRRDVDESLSNIPVEPLPESV